MGRETTTRVRYGDREAQARVVLEGDVLILRRPVAARIARADLHDPAIEGETLTMTAPEGRLTLFLGADQAAKWLKAIRSPPPCLADKLGIKPGLPVWRHGALDAPELAEALTGADLSGVEPAALGLVRAGSANDLLAALAAAGQTPPPLWIIHGKGADAFGDAAVRSFMRERGWIDSKACAVSADLSATRYGRRKI